MSGLSVKKRGLLYNRRRSEREVLKMYESDTRCSLNELNFIG